MYKFADVLNDCITENGGPYAVLKGRKVRHYKAQTEDSMQVRLIYLVYLECNIYMHISKSIRSFGHLTLLRLKCHWYIKLVFSVKKKVDRKKVLEGS